MQKQFQDVGKFVVQDFKNTLPYLKFQSISAQNKAIPETVAYLVNQFKKLGAQDVKTFTEYQNPAIYASFAGKNTNKTILFYNHYDVQPPEPLNEWQSDPFNPTFKDGKIIARGVSDDKGELMSRLSIIRYFNTHGGLPCNLKFFVEGEEEIGSPDIESYIANHDDQLTCDAIIWEGAGKNTNEQFQVIAGAKGIVSFDVSVETAETDIHSSLAGYVPNAAWRLITGLSTLIGTDNKIKVDHFYDQVPTLTSYETQIISDMESRFDDQATIRSFGLKDNRLTSDQPMHELMNQPTITINGLSAGYEGTGTKTVIPRQATAKMDCRLVPGQDPTTCFNLIQDQLVRNGYADLKLSFNIAEDGFRTNLQDPFVQLNLAVAKTVYGNTNVALVPNQSGGGPMTAFYSHLKAPIVAIGVRNAADARHAPNENIRVVDYQEASVYLANLLFQFAQN